MYSASVLIPCKQAVSRLCAGRPSAASSACLADDSHLSPPSHSITFFHYHPTRLMTFLPSQRHSCPRTKTATRTLPVKAATQVQPALFHWLDDYDDLSVDSRLAPPLPYLSQPLLSPQLPSYRLAASRTSLSPFSSLSPPRSPPSSKISTPFRPPQLLALPLTRRPPVGRSVPLVHRVSDPAAAECGDQAGGPVPQRLVLAAETEWDGLESSHSLEHVQRHQQGGQLLDDGHLLAGVADQLLGDEQAARMAPTEQ